MGDALPVWRRHYSRAKLHGCDYVPASVERCREINGKIATIFQAGWEDLQGSWDVIYCSNVLEHFVNHVDIARSLLSHCQILYVMTPYKERQGGKDITSMNESGHVTTLYRDTFKQVGAVRTKVIRAPVAWGPTYWQELRSRLGMYRRLRPYHPMRQIIYTITP
ncbi:class I SAM-dependent methyltransferase [Paludibaculum fermentans]|uniref:class I SAM-dependent methyltransferase n=1 Tax=Paludibaculum fermentans TaxID=1473598 RepID=UPI003EB94E81